MGKRKREQRPPKVNEVEVVPDLFDDWDDDGGERVRVRPHRPKDEGESRAKKKIYVEPYKKERRRRREVIEF